MFYEGNNLWLTQNAITIISYTVPYNWILNIVSNWHLYYDFFGIGKIEIQNNTNTFHLKTVKAC